MRRDPENPALPANPLPAARLVAALALACLAALTGCTGSPAPEFAPGTSPGAAPACDRNTATVSFGEISRYPQLTGARLLTVSAEAGRTLTTVEQDGPIGFNVDGIPPGDDWKAWLISRAREKHPAVAGGGRSPALSETDSRLAAVTGTGSYVAFTGADEITVPFDLSCAGGPVQPGQLIGWGSPTADVLPCAQTPAPDSLAAQARKYCPLG